MYDMRTGREKKEEKTWKDDEKEGRKDRLIETGGQKTY